MLVLAIVASKRWEVNHMDVKSDFIHEDIYMQQTKGFIHDPSLFFRLNKSLYGLKQSPWAWYANMDNFLYRLDLKDENITIKYIYSMLVIYCRQY